jgi:DNA-binding NarL/FixJ family response regulator
MRTVGAMETQRAGLGGAPSQADVVDATTGPSVSGTRLGHPAVGGPSGRSVVRELRRHSPALPAAPARVVIADDEQLFRLGLEQLLRTDPRLEVVGLAADGEEAVQLCERLQPDLVLINFRMPGIGGLAATRRIIGSGCGTKVVILTSSALKADVAAAFHAGARGYIVKDSEGEALVRSLLAVHSGAQVFTGSRTDEGSEWSGVLGGAEPDVQLTAGEQSILVLVAEGAGNRDIARHLGISEKTVRNHMSHIYRKLQVSGRSGVLLYAMRKGLVNA